MVSYCLTHCQSGFEIKDAMRTHIEFLDSLYSFQIQIEGELSALRCRIVRDQFNRIQSPVVCCLPIQAPISCVGWLTLKNIKIGFNSSVPGIPPVPPISHFYSHLFSQARAALSEIEWLVSDISHEQQHSCSLYCCPEGPPPPSWYCHLDSIQHPPLSAQIGKTVVVFLCSRIIVNPFCLLSRKQIELLFILWYHNATFNYCIYCGWIIEVFSSECLVE